MRTTITIFCILIFNFTYSQGKYDGKEIIIYAKAEKQPKSYDRGKGGPETKSEKKERKKRKKKQNLEKQRLQLLEFEKIAKEKQRLKNENKVFEILSFNSRKELASTNNTLVKFEDLNTKHLDAILKLSNKLELKESLLTDIETEINILRNNLTSENRDLLSRGQLAISVSSLSDRLIDLFAFSAEYTSFSVASSRIQFINSVLKEYLKNETLTVQWVFEEIYKYSTSNYLKNTNKNFLKSINGLADLSGLISELEDNQRGYRRLQRQTMRELKKIENVYRKYYKEYEALRSEFLKIPKFDIYLKNNIELAKSNIELMKFNISEDREKAQELLKQ
jgi:hypothetical protein